MAKPVYDLLDSLDLFSVWTIFLLAAGYAATARRSVGSAAIGILVWWGLYVLLKVAHVGGRSSGLPLAAAADMMRVLRLVPRAPLAQLDRATDYESVGRPFESGGAHHFFY